MKLDGSTLHVQHVVPFYWISYVLHFSHTFYFLLLFLDRLCGNIRGGIQLLRSCPHTDPVVVCHFVRDYCFTVVRYLVEVECCGHFVQSFVLLNIFVVVFLRSEVCRLHNTSV
jgi:hypothetical protein